MRTADEILEENFPTPDDEDRQMIINAMKEYAKEACEEQRKICSNKPDGWDNDAYSLSQKILNAPLPELK
jgi:hypothetical protein